jgi:hypothetical protein
VTWTALANTCLAAGAEGRTYLDDYGRNIPCVTLALFTHSHWHSCANTHFLHDDVLSACNIAITISLQRDECTMA